MAEPVLSVATMAGCAKSNSDSGSGDNSTGFAEDGYARGNFNDTMHTYFFDFWQNRCYDIKCAESAEVSELADEQD